MQLQNVGWVGLGSWARRHRADQLALGGLGQPLVRGRGKQGADLSLVARLVVDLDDGESRIGTASVLNFHA